MSNSPLAAITIPSPNRSSPRNRGIDRITIHCVVGQLTAAEILRLFTSPARKASCNYAVGKDGDIGLGVREADRSWCTSSPPNDNRAVTIETACDMAPPYTVRPAAFAALVDLVEDICRRNGKRRLLWLGDRERTLRYTPAADEMVLTVHRWFAAKACPGGYLFERHGEIAAEVTARLEEDDGMSYDKFVEYMQRYEDERAMLPPMAWSQEARGWAESRGLIGGDGAGNMMYQSPCTREQLAAILYRLEMGKESRRG